jgi:4-hydroxymandelate oxidase
MTPPALARRRLLTQATRPRLAPSDELVNVFEYEVQAGRVLSGDARRALSGSDRAPFDRITLRPRMMVNCVNLDLTVELAGLRMFAPIIVGPVAGQATFHPEGELATARGASAAKATVVISARSSMPVADVAREATAGSFYQVFASDDVARNRAGVEAAVKAGCRALLVTVGQTSTTDRTSGRLDWSAVKAMRPRETVPLFVKGIMTPDEARAAVGNGAQGLVVSNYGQPGTSGRPSPLDVLPAIVDAVDGRVPVLVDGGFRRGTDIIKALAFGARAVLVGRPVMWGLAAYGADGVRSVVEMLQTDLGRVMGCCGKPNLAALDRSVVRLHAPHRTI